MVSKLGYWAIRGIGQPARLMLKYAGVPFEEVRYIPKGDPRYDAEIHTDWMDVKFTMGLDFPNIPYYIDGDVKLSQSGAIYRYLAAKHDLYGSNEKERALVDMVSEQTADLKAGVMQLVYFPTSQEDYEEKSKMYQVTLPEKLKPFEDFLGEKQWMVGDKLTYADFQWYEMLNQHILMCPGCLDNFPKLQAYNDRLEQLPAIKAYMESDEFIREPINGYTAYFTG